jgi:hypothetical protein
VQNLTDARATRPRDYFCAASSKVANANNPFRFHRIDCLSKMGVTRLEQEGSLRRSQFFRRPVSSGAFHKNKGAVVQNQMFLKESIRELKSLRE